MSEHEAGGSERSPQEVLVELAREYEDAYRERRNTPPESYAEVELDGYRRGLRKAIELFEELDSFEKEIHLPEWQIGLENSEGDWEWFYPHALTRERATEKAREEARESLGDGHLNAYEVAGPAATDGGSSGSEHCPNCTKTGSHHLSAGESGAENDEYRCNNPNCRVAYYEVEPPDAVTDGGHRLATDRVDGYIFAECPNKETDIDDHFGAQIEYGDAVENDVYETFESILPDECRACGESIEIIGQETPSEVLTDGGRIQPEYEPLFDDRDRETFRLAVETWGIDAQADMAEEECAEFIVESKHWARGKNEVEDVIDELADLRIMAEQLTEFIGQELVEERVRFKMNRLRERLADAGVEVPDA